MRCILDFSKRAIRYARIALPLVTVEVLVLLFAFWAMEQQNVWQSRLEIAWNIYIPGWLAGGIFVIAAVGSTAYITYLRARDYPVVASAATIAGVATACSLMWWPTQQCNHTGGIVAGITVSCIVIAGGMVINLRARKIDQGTVADDKAIPAQSNVESEKWRIGIVPFLQISLAVFMAIIVLMAFTNDDLGESRTELLLFAGIGITAASAISVKRSLKNALAMAGAAVSVVGAFLGVSQAVALSSSEIGILTILAAAGLIAGIVVMFLSFGAHVIVRLLVTPILSASAAFGIALLLAIIPVVFISNGCGVPMAGTYFSVLASGLFAVIAGLATFVVLTWMAAREWWISRRVVR